MPGAKPRQVNEGVELSPLGHIWHQGIALLHFRGRHKAKERSEMGGICEIRKPEKKAA